jgi:hypothetical protein
VSSGSEGDENNMPAAYNASIYLMVGVPYAVLGVLGFLIYRGCKKNAQYRKTLAQAGEPGPVRNSYPAMLAGKDPSWTAR